MATITGTSSNDTLNGTNQSDIIYGGEGSDTIHGMKGDDIVVGEQYALAYSNIAGTVTIPSAVTFGGDHLYGDQGNDSLFGDLVNLSFVVQAGIDSSQRLGGASIASPFTISFGNDMLDGGVGEDKLVGDVGYILLSAHAGLAVNGAADAVLENISMLMGADTLLGGNGNDKLYGDVENMSLESIGGLANSTNGTGASSSTFMRGIYFLGGNDSLSGGEGDDLLIGDIGNLNLSARSADTLGTGDSSFARISSQGAQTDKFVMGNDSLDGGNGDDVLIGDVGQLNITAIASLAEGLASGRGVRILGDYLQCGNDTLNGGNGNDSIFGDVQSIITLEKGGETPFAAGSITGYLENYSEPFVAFNWVMGNDKLDGGNGNDLMVGDVGIIDTQLIAGYTSTGNLFSSASAGEGVFAPVSRVFGDDSLLGGNGNDQIYGDGISISYLLQGGLNEGVTTSQVAATAGMWYVSYAFGNDFLDGGNGNDQLVGDVGSFKITAINGTGVGTVPVDDGISITYGNDVLLGGGGNDFLYGDTISSGELHLLLQGYLVNTQADTHYDFRFGSNPNYVAFGNDVLNGGDGNDALVGDTHDMPGLVAGQPNNAGASINPDTLGEIFTSTLLWGNDVMTGGAGADKFVESLDDHRGTIQNPLMAMQGADIITDFSPRSGNCGLGSGDGDQLVFNNVLDSNSDGKINAVDLDRVTSFADFTLNGEQEIAIIFHAAGSDPVIDFESAIANFISTHSGASLQDVAQYIYQSSTPSLITGSASLAGDVPSGEAPLGAVILQGHSTSQTGYASFVDLNSHFEGVLSINPTNHGCS